MLDEAGSSLFRSLLLKPFVNLDDSGLETGTSSPSCALLHCKQRVRSTSQRTCRSYLRFLYTERISQCLPYSVREWLRCDLGKITSLLLPFLVLNDLLYAMGLDNLFALACEVLNHLERFEIYLVKNIGSKKVQVVIVSLERDLGVSLYQRQEGLVDLEVMPTDDREDIRSNRSLQWRLEETIRGHERGILVINSSSRSVGEEK